MDIEVDLKELRLPIPAAPIASADIEALFTSSQLLQKKGITFQALGSATYQLTWLETTFQVTFDSQRFDESPSLRLLTWGDPLFQNLLSAALA